MGAQIRRKLVVIAVMTAIATLTGPFGTFGEMPLVSRLGYWGTIIIGIAVVVNLSLVVFLSPRWLGALHSVARIALAVAVATVPGAAIIVLVEAQFFQAPFTLDRIEERAIYVALISFMVAYFEMHVRPRVVAHADQSKYTTMKMLARLAHATDGSVPSPQDDLDTVETAAEGHLNLTPAPAPTTTRATKPSRDVRPVFLRNLDARMGEELLSISTQDHYLDVVTRAGQERILKRMSDALVELDGYRGLHIHRSHWVALDAIEAIVKDGRKCHVRLVDGRMLPVSRPNVAVVTQALEAERAQPTSG